MMIEHEEVDNQERTDERDTYPFIKFLCKEESSNSTANHQNDENKDVVLQEQCCEAPIIGSNAMD